jgi:hypothetical protein
MSEGTSTQVQLGPEDAERMRHLTEEVQGRLEEMAVIASGALGQTLDRDTVPRFVPLRRYAGDQSDAVAATDDLLYIELLPQPGGGTACALFCPGHEVFIENPCGSGPIPCPPP